MKMPCIIMSGAISFRTTLAPNYELQTLAINKCKMKYLPSNNIFYITNGIFGGVYKFQNTLWLHYQKIHPDMLEMYFQILETFSCI